MFWSCFLLLLFNLSFTWSGGGDAAALPIHCEYSCEPPPSQPIYGIPPPSQPSEPVYESPPPPLPSPPSEPVYESPPPPSPRPPPLPPSEPVYETPHSPSVPSCEPPPSPPSPNSPLYGLPQPPPPPPPPVLPENCQQSMQNCTYPPPSPDIYQTVDTASHLHLNCLHVIIFLLFLFFLHF